jgi:hypothetical protein
MSIKAALNHRYAKEFMDAFAEEVKSLKDMKTFEEFLGNPADIPKGSLLASKAIFSIVYNPDGTFKKFKARLVARGDQLKNIYDSDTYAGTIKSDTLRLFFSVVASLDLDLRSHDVKTAFLYPELKQGENIFLRRPAGVSDDTLPPIVKLLKCIYGLPQASKYFDNHFSAVLYDIGFTRCISDDQLFILRRADDYVYLLKHVDDVLMAAPRGSRLMDEVSDTIGTKYKVTRDDSPANFVGLAITRNRGAHKITLTQPKYIETSLQRFEIPFTSPSFPMQEDYLTRMPDDDEIQLLPSSAQTLFQEKVGTLLYLASQTRPDLLYSVTQLSRRSNKCTLRDMKAADRVFSYVALTPHIGLTLGTISKDFVIHAFVDASYNCYPIDNKSHTGISLHLGFDSGAFLAYSKKQSIVSDSTTIAEYIASHTACQKLLWSKNVLIELGLNPSIVLHQDNTSTINLLHHPGNTGRTKHLALRYNMIRETIKNHNISVAYTSTTDMTADILTKPLGPTLYNHHQKSLLQLQ